MFRRVYGKVPWRTVSVLLSVVTICAFTAAASGRGGSSSGRMGGGGMPRMGGGMPRGGSSPGGRSFSGSSRGERSFAAPSRSSGGSSRAFSPPSRSSGERSSAVPSRNYSMGSPSGRGMSSGRAPAEFRSSQPRIGSDSGSRRGFSEGSSSLPRYNSRSMAGVPRSTDSLGGRGYSRSAQDLGISRPQAFSSRGGMDSIGGLDRGSRGMSDVGRSGMADRSSRSISRGGDSIARQIARPDGAGRSSNLSRGMSESIGRSGPRETISRADRGTPISRSLDSVSRGGDSMSRQISRGGAADGSRPVWRTNDSVSRQISRPDASSRMRRAPEISQRSTRSESIGRTVADRGSLDRAPISRPLDRSSAMADAGGIRRSANFGRNLNVSRGLGRDSVSRTGRSAESLGRSSSSLGRSTSSLSRSASSLSRGSSNRSSFGRDSFTQSARSSLRSKDIYVTSAKYHGEHRGGHRGGDWGHGWHGGRWGHGDRHYGHWGGHWGGWHGVEVNGWHGHHGWWRDYGWHYGPRSYWSFGFNFGYYGYPAVVDCGFSYVYPGYYYPPVVTYYSSYYWPTFCPPVVYTPIVAPVYTPVVVAPAYYYWYPAYSYYYAYPSVVAPAVVAPAYVVPSTSFGVSVGVSADAAEGASNDVAQPAASESAEASVATAVQGDSLEQGLAALRNGQVETAREHFSRAVSADPSSGVAQMLYVAALVADGQYKSASLSLREGLQIWSSVQLKDFYLPNVYGDAGHYTQYTRDLRAFLSDHPDRLDGWLLTIWATAFSGHGDEAMQLLAEAKKTWPDDPALVAMEKVVGTES